MLSGNLTRYGIFFIKFRLSTNQISGFMIRSVPKPCIVLAPTAQCVICRLPVTMQVRYNTSRWVVDVSNLLVGNFGSDDMGISSGKLSITLHLPTDKSCWFESIIPNVLIHDKFWSSYSYPKLQSWHISQSISDGNASVTKDTTVHAALAFWWSRGLKSFSKWKQRTATSNDSQAMCWFNHWGRVTHICIGKLTIIDSDNGLSSGRRQAIIQTNAGILLIGPLGTNLSEI